MLADYVLSPLCGPLPLDVTEYYTTTTTTTTISIALVTDSMPLGLYRSLLGTMYYSKSLLPFTVGAGEIIPTYILV
jgi:hypothetical protein